MCGRFTLRTPLSKVIAQLGLPLATDVPARYNIAPSQEILAVRLGPAGKELTPIRWGFLPTWAPDATGAMINARSETAASKPTFREAFRQRRCLIPADGFYEWKKAGRRKEPHYIDLTDGRPFAFAGLWERWRDTDTCAILTTAANPLLKPLHERMPVILNPPSFDRWLDPAAAPEQLQPLLAAYPSEAMRVTPVGLRVNSVANDDATCLEPPATENLLF
jgi:putative SOS response-associated peptidase YedK